MICGQGENSCLYAGRYCTCMAETWKWLDLQDEQVYTEVTEQDNVQRGTQ